MDNGSAYFILRHLFQENEDGFIKGTQTVHVNGEEQTVYIMQQAPEHVSNLPLMFSSRIFSPAVPFRHPCALEVALDRYQS